MVQHVKRELQSAKSRLWRAQFREAACRTAKATVPTFQIGELQGFLDVLKARLESNSVFKTRKWHLIFLADLRDISELLSKVSIGDLGIHVTIHPTGFTCDCAHICKEGLSPNLMSETIHEITSCLQMTNKNQHIKIVQYILYSNALIYTPLYPLHKHAICSKAHQQPVSWSTHGIPWCNRSPQTSPNPLRNPGSTQASENQNGKPQHNEDG